jgi:hypothetical protein
MQGRDNQSLPSNLQVINPEERFRGATCLTNPLSTPMHHQHRPKISNDVLIGWPSIATKAFGEFWLGGFDSGKGNSLADDGGASSHAIGTAVLLNESQQCCDWRYAQARQRTQIYHSSSLLAVETSLNIPDTSQ